MTFVIPLRWRCREVIAGDRDEEIGVADASVLVLAERYRTCRVASLDHRHLDVLRLLDGGYVEMHRCVS